MLTAERHRAILRLLAEQGRVPVAEIAARFGISTATARRDMVVLARAGKATRSYGGLLPASFFQDGPDLAPGAAQPMDTTARLARRAGDLLPHEGNVFVDAGTICLAVGRLLLARPDLRIFTNSVPLVALAAQAQATLTGIGGEVQKSSLALTGPLALAWIANLRFDAVVIGAAGLDPVKGAGTDDPQLAAIKTEVLRRAFVRVLVADGQEWNRPAAVRFALWSAFTAFVTDRDPPREAQAALAGAKVKLFLI
jgi:DeoR family transcriptional regulator, fructose operon transcriptional repressor